MEKIVKLLFEYQDLEYKDFTKKLNPNIEYDSIIGVRVPTIRKIAKEVIKDDDYILFLDELPHKYFEEYMLHGILISLIKDLDEVLFRLDNFLPYVNNWAVCDSMTPKLLKKDYDKSYKFLEKCVKSNEVYRVRFGIVSFIDFYLDDKFDQKYNKLIANIKSNEYYINMAIAWYFSFALIKQYDSTIGIIENKQLDKWVHNKSIQKAIESYRIDDKKKDYLRSLKVK